MIHLWAYDDLNQRDKCRAAMQADPDWQAYLPKNRPFMVTQETRIMKCAPFFVERLKKMLAAAKMSAVHPQVAAILERAASSPLPPYHEVPPAVARRLYRDTRGPLTPDPPAVEHGAAADGAGPAAGPVPVRAYRPKGAGKDEMLPALVYFHGGGWVIGDLDTHDVVCRTLANGARCAVFSVEYRKAPESPFPAAVDDCFSALSFVSKNSRSLKVNAKQIAVGGDSAGGNLATVMALMARDAGGPGASSLPGADLPGRPTSAWSIRRSSATARATCSPRRSCSYFRGHYLPREADWLDWRASPLLAKSLARPAAGLRASRRASIRWWTRAGSTRSGMQKEGVQVEYRNYPDMVHGFITMGRVLDTANAALADCAQALKKRLGRLKPDLQAPGTAARSSPTRSPATACAPRSACRARASCRCWTACTTCKDRLKFVICRQEGGASYMAEAWAKLTGEPGVLFVTRGPGATNGAVGVHTAFQDSTPMVVFVGQVGNDFVEREAFQEVDYRRMYGPLTKWVAQIDRAERIPEYVSHAFHTATAGRPGPVLLALPEDMLFSEAAVADAPRYRTPRAAPSPADMQELERLLARRASGRS